MQPALIVLVLELALACSKEFASARTCECNQVRARTCIKSVPYIVTLYYFKHTGHEMQNSFTKIVAAIL